MSYRLMLISCFDPPDPPELCKHGIYVYHFCENCDEDKNPDVDNTIKERKENE